MNCLYFNYLFIYVTFHCLLKPERVAIFHKTGDDQHSDSDLCIDILPCLQQSMIMDENVDKERDKRSSMSRKLIQRTVKYPGRPKQTLAEEIAFAKDIVLLRHARPKDAAVSKAKREVPREDVSMTSLDRGASTSNSAKIRVLNHKDYKTWKVRTERIYGFGSTTGLLK